jgi:hypothetical protein
MNELSYIASLRSTEEVVPPQAEDEGLAKSGAFDILHPLQRKLDRGGIGLSAPVYVGLVLTLSFFLFVCGLQIGPLFALVLGVAFAYELVVSHPNECVARQGYVVNEQLPVCLDRLGHCLDEGLPLERALVSAANRLPKGALARELTRIVLRIQRGASPEIAVREFCERMPGPEIRAFVAALHLYALGSVCVGRPFLELAAFLRRHRISLRSALGRVALVRRLLFVAILFIGTLSLALPFVFGTDGIHPRAGFDGLLAEAGGIVVIMSSIWAMRLTAHQAWEASDDD